MEPVLTRCGYRCDLCLAYRPNIEAHPENRQILSDGWYQFFGFRVQSEHISCDGCMAEDPHLIDQACPVRPCAMERALANCAACPDFGCDKLQERLVDYETISRRVGTPIPPADRERFILPYENCQRLAELRRKR